jgi:hypothetical protein
MPPQVLAAIPSLFQAGVGLSQMIQGQHTLKNLVRPEYNIPGEAQSSLTLAKQAYSDPYSTGEIRAQQNIGLSTANAYANARDGGQVSNYAPAIQARQSQGYNQLQTQVEADRERRMGNLQSNLDIMAKYQDQKWQLNKFAPYSDKYNQAREQIGGGEQNLFGGLNGLSSIGQMAFSRSSASAPPNPTVAAPVTSAAVNQNGSNQAIFDYITKQFAANAQKYGQYIQPTLIR